MASIPPTPTPPGGRSGPGHSGGSGSGGRSDPGHPGGSGGRSGPGHSGSSGGSTGRRLRAWAGRHPRRAGLALARILVEGLAGAALGALLAGILVGGGVRLWTTTGALAAGTVLAGLRARQQVAAALGPREVALRWGRWLGGFAAGVVGLLGLTALVQLNAMAVLPPLTQDRVAAFDRLWRAMDRYYPYFEQKGVDWAALYQEYRPRVMAARDDAAYFQAIREMLARLQDSHTGLTAPRPATPEKWLGMVEEIEGQAVVTRVARDVTLPGLVPGAVILARDGLPVATYLERLPPWLTVGSTPRQRRMQAYARTLVIPLETPVTLTYESPGGERHQVTVRWPPATPPAHGPATPASAPPAVSATPAAATGTSAPAPEAAPPLITGRRLPSGLGLVRIPTFSSSTGHDLVAEFDAALESLWDAPGLIIDLRGNGGGNAALANQMAGRLVERPVAYGYDLLRRPVPLRGWARRYVHWLRPRGRTYTGPVALLIDTGNVSTAETFIISLHDTGRALTVGRPTSGGSGSPVTVRLPGGGRVRYSLADFRRLSGTSLEGRGIEPDRPVAWRIADLRTGRDPDLAAAEIAILAAAGKPANSTQGGSNHGNP